MRKRLLSIPLALVLLLALIPAAVVLAADLEEAPMEAVEAGREESTGRGIEPLSSGMSGGTAGERLEAGDDTAVPQRINIYRNGRLLEEASSGGTAYYIDSVARGGAAEYTAQVVDSDGNEMAGSFSWYQNASRFSGNPYTLTADFGSAATVTVAADTSGGMLQAKIQITAVDKEDPRLTILSGPLYIPVDTAEQIAAVCDSDGLLSYKSSNPAVAGVDGAGVVRAKSAGSAVITVTAAETERYCSASASVGVTVVGKAIQTEWIMAKDMIYTGEAITPEVTVTDGQTLLVEHRDYEMFFSEAVDVGVFDIGIFGIGSYSGTAYAAFQILPAEIKAVAADVPDKTIFANDKSNASINGLRAELALPDKVSVVYAGGRTAALDVSWSGPGAVFQPKGGTYTFTGTIVHGDNFLPYEGMLEASITVEPVSVTEITAPGLLRNITAAKAAVLSGGASLASLGVPDSLTMRCGTHVPETITAQWDKTLDALIELAGKVGAVPEEMTIRLDPGCLPPWATYDSSVLPSIRITVTPKLAANITLPAIADKIYDGRAAAVPLPSASDENGASLTDGTWTYVYRGTGGTSYESASAPKDAGSYLLEVFYNSDTHQGAGSTGFQISPRQVTLSWSGLADLTYSGAPADVTARIDEDSLAPGDAVAAVVTGGREVNAGSYTAEAVLSSQNYTAVNPAQVYTIAKAERNLRLTPAALALNPAAGLKGTVTAEFDGQDGSEAAKLSFALTDISGGRDAAVLSAGGREAVLTAVGNGRVQVTAVLEETGNYKGGTASVVVEALARPVLDVRASGENLAAALEGGTIRVVGLGDAEAVQLTLVLPEDVSGGLRQSPAPAEAAAHKSAVSVWNGDDLIASYTVDLSGVSAAPENIVFRTGAPSAEAPADGGEALREAAAGLNPKADRLTAAAKDTLLEAAADITGAEAGSPVVIEASLKILVEGLTVTEAEKSLTMEIKPFYTVKAGDEILAGKEITGSLAVPVVAGITLPDGFPIENLYVRHYEADGAALKEILPVVISLENGKYTASWEQASFSRVRLVEDNRRVAVTFTKADGTTETAAYTPASVNTALPDSGTATHGWTVQGKVYTKLTDELLTVLSSAAVDGWAAVDKTDAPDVPGVPDVPPAPEGPSTPDVPSVPSVPTQPGGSSGGTSGSRHSGGASSGQAAMVSVSNSSHGSVAVSPRNPVQGGRVTLTVRPDAGYGLASIRVTDAKGAEVALTKTGDLEYAFTMPAGRISVEASFTGFPFADAAGSWAREAIAWAYSQGYINGTSRNAFSPDASITRQQAWMILARLSGENPAGMAAAREWASGSGITDGTGGGSAMTRQQLAAFLYRYARNQGAGLGEPASISDYPDSGTVSGYAREPMAWAVGRGIITGTSEGTLNPGGNATRAQFVVMLQRFCGADTDGGSR